MGWYRAYHGAPFHPKWRIIAKQAGCRPGDVAAVFWALLDVASQAEERGTIYALERHTASHATGDRSDRHRCIELVSSALEYDLLLVQTIFDIFEDRKLIVDGRLKNWEKRQPKREDRSAPRMRRLRERQRVSRDAPVTHGDDRAKQNRTEQSRYKQQPRAREEVSESDRLLANVRTRLFELANLDWNKHISPGWHTQADRTVKRWLDAGCDPEQDIYPTIERLTSKASTPPGSLAYFVEAVLEAHDRRLAGVAAVEDRDRPGNSFDGRTYMRPPKDIPKDFAARTPEHWLTAARWAWHCDRRWKPPPYDPVTRLGGKTIMHRAPTAADFAGVPLIGRAPEVPQVRPMLPVASPPPAAEASDDDSTPPWERSSIPAANGRWPTNEEIATTYPLAAPYVRALRDRRRDRRWTMPSGEVVTDRDPLPEDFLPPAEALRMRELGDPLKAMTTSGGNDARQ